MQKGLHERGALASRTQDSGYKSAKKPAPVVEAAYLLERGDATRTVPLLERLRILGLLASVLDHYFVEKAPAQSEKDQGEIAASLDPLLQRSYVELDESLLPALSDESAASKYAGHRS